jgi:hypothetical protein
MSKVFAEVVVAASTKPARRQASFRARKQGFHRYSISGLPFRIFRRGHDLSYCFMAQHGGKGGIGFQEKRLFTAKKA